MKKIFKKIGKGIKTGLKSIGKAFKSAFKSIGKFIGKLGPIGMIGMMLIMPQLGAWWGQFGAWAGKTAGALGKVMTGIHKAGAFVGNAYGTITETISKTMNVVTGGTFSSAGAAGYQAGGSDQLASWMSSKLDVAREGLGLQTSGGVVPSVETDVVTPPTDGTIPTVDGAGNPISAADQEALRNLSTPGYNLADGTITPKPAGIDAYTGVPSVDQAALNLQDSFGYSDTPDFTELTPDIIKPTFEGPSTFDKVKKIATTAYTTGSAIQDAATKFGLTAEEYEEQYGGGLGVVDGGVAMYDAAQTNWTSQGYGGEPSYGMGNPRYFESIYSYGDLLPFGRI